MLGLHDFTRLHSLSGVETAPALECLAFGGLIWPSKNYYYVPELENTNLKSVMFSAAVDMESVLKFLSVDGLQRLDFECNRYPTEFLAWICANYPWVEGYCLKPYMKFENPSDNFAIVCGKRKKTLRDLNDQKTRRALDNAAEQFENMKRRFAGIPFEELQNIIK